MRLGLDLDIVVHVALTPTVNLRLLILMFPISPPLMNCFLKIAVKCNVVVVQFG